MIENSTSAEEIISKAIEVVCPSIHERAKTSEHDYIELTRMQEASLRVWQKGRLEMLEEIEHEIRKYGGYDYRLVSSAEMANHLLDFLGSLQKREEKP